MTKQKELKYNFKSGYGYLFVGAAIASLVAEWEYINHAKIGGASPHFAIPGLIGICLCIFLFAAMSYSARAIIKRLIFPRSLLILAVIVAILTIGLAVNAVFVAETTGYLYR